MSIKESELSPKPSLSAEQRAVLSQVTAYLVDSGIARRYAESMKRSAQSHRADSEAEVQAEPELPKEASLMLAAAHDEAAQAELPLGLYTLAHGSQATTPDGEGPKELGLLRVDPNTSFNFEHTSSEDWEDKDTDDWHGFSSEGIAEIQEDGTVTPNPTYADLKPEVFDELLRLVDTQKAVGLEFRPDSEY
ncbi:MAG TPA: hypothetical protein VMR34_02945 [Candidatus Saccharimonadales bacterium]|nr:hypothetical protein [Candidatus Saccharimonadales bacterium]